MPRLKRVPAYCLHKPSGQARVIIDGEQVYLGRFGSDFLSRHRPDLIIYFADGFGPAPDYRPRMPVVWCLTEDGQQRANWGRLIRMQTSNG